ncbi:N-acetylmuramoyl-L-alanine amidase [bacterium]|nr:N-acetylmuramoyl-L-alanine amidase [bacterium]
MTHPHPTNPVPPLALWIVILLVAITLHRTATAQTVSTRKLEGHAFVSIVDLAHRLGAEIEYVTFKDKVILRRPGGTNLVFTRFSSYYLLGSVQYRTPVPSRTADGQFYVSSDVMDILDLAPATPNTPPARLEEPASSSIEQRTFEMPSEEVLRQKWAINKIVIDPGHGGRDPGAVGPGQTREKNITLAIARRLGKQLERDLGLEVVYTRSKDVFTRLRTRARIAREADADLFVSLHCNAGRRRAAGGIEVYFLSEAKTAEAAAAAERENAVIELEEDLEQDTGNTLRDMVLEILSSQYLKESEALAASIRSRMTRRFKSMDDRGVKQANFYVMRGTMGAMPSVLVEMGFISNPTEEKLLKKTSFQKDMADAIFEGIRAFKRSHERQLKNNG